MQHFKYKDTHAHRAEESKKWMWQLDLLHLNYSGGEEGGRRGWNMNIGLREGEVTNFFTFLHWKHIWPLINNFPFTILWFCGISETAELQIFYILHMFFRIFQRYWVCPICEVPWWHQAHKMKLVYSNPCNTPWLPILALKIRESDLEFRLAQQGELACTCLCAKMRKDEARNQHQPRSRG